MAVLYFAYGSNLLTERLVARCPSARVVGPAVLPNHTVAFDKQSTVDGSAKATILPAEGRVASGVVFRLNALDLNVLDRIEGVGHGYDRIDAVEVIAGAARYEVATYRARAPGTDVPPWDWYLALVVAGALQHRLPRPVVDGLTRHPFAPDPDHARPQRDAAVAALRAAGHHDWPTLLQDPVGRPSNSSS